MDKLKSWACSSRGLVLSIFLASLLPPLTHATVTTFNFNDTTSGQISKITSTYSAKIHWGNMTIQHASLLGITRNVYYQFNTSAIPANAIISLVEWNYQKPATEPTPSCTLADLYVGNWIGTSLDGSAADFNGGNYLLFSLLDFSANTWIDLSTGGCDSTTDCYPGLFIAGNATTDFKVVCADTDTANRQYQFESAGAKTQLRVTWTLPQNNFTVNFTAPTPANNSVVNTSYAFVNSSISQNVTSCTFYWKGLGNNNATTPMVWSAAPIASKISILDQTVIANTSILNISSVQVYGLALDDNSTVWIPYSYAASNNNVSKINETTANKIINYTVGGLPYAAAVDINGNVWITIQGTTVLKAIYPNGTTLYSYAYGALVDGTPKGVAADSFGNVWVALGEVGGDPGLPGGLARINISDGHVITNYTIAGELNALAFDGAYIWATSGINLTKVDARTGAIVANYSIPANGVTVDSNGFVWLTPGPKKIDPSSGAILFQNTAGLTQYGISADSQGNVWAIDTANKLMEETRTNDGAMIANITLPKTAADVAWPPTSYGDATGYALRHFVFAGKFIGYPMTTVNLSTGTYAYYNMTGLNPGEVNQYYVNCSNGTATNISDTQWVTYLPPSISTPPTNGPPPLPNYQVDYSKEEEEDAGFQWYLPLFAVVILLAGALYLETSARHPR